MGLSLQNKEPNIVFREENLLSSADWYILTTLHKSNKYTILYDDEENIYINPTAENSQRIFEILGEIFKQKYMNRKFCRLQEEAERLTDTETGDYLLDIWHEWRKKVAEFELHTQAESIIKRMRSKRLYSKVKKNREMISELYNIGFYGDGKEAKSFRRGTENAFMYGYLLGMESCSPGTLERGDAILR